jgi:hypothetical protein
VRVLPREVVAPTFKPDISRSGEFVLKATASNELVALAGMPDRVFGIFYKLVERAAAGEIEPPLSQTERSPPSQR